MLPSRVSYLSGKEEGFVMVIPWAVSQRGGRFSQTQDNQLMIRSFASLVLAASLASCSSPETPAAKSAAPSTDNTELIMPDQFKADLAALYKGLQDGHIALYANKPAADYDALFEVMLNEAVAPLSEAEAYKKLQAFTAFGDVAHASIAIPDDLFAPLQQDEAKSFPIYPRFVDGKFYVGEDYSGVDGVSPGDRIVSINGQPVEHWLDVTTRYIAADTDYIANSLMEFRFPHYLWLAEGEIDAFDLKIERQDGSLAAITVPALTSSEKSVNAATDETAETRPERHVDVLDGHIGYLRPGPFYNFEDPANLWDNTNFKTFIDEAFETYLTEDVDTLIIDLRQNPGGDSSFSDHMLAWLADEPFAFASEFIVRSSAAAEAGNNARRAANPGGDNPISDAYTRLYKETPYGETFTLDLPAVPPREGERFEGEVFALIDRNSYSQAVNVAASIQDYGIGTLVGEPTADFATTYGSVETFTLPQTGFTVQFPKAHIIRPSGDRVPGGVVPDLLIEREIVEHVDDETIEAVLERLR